MGSGGLDRKHRVRVANGLVALALVFAPGVADAGIVNVQSVLATDVEEGLSASFTGTVDWRTGNSNVLLGSLATVARYRHGDHLGFAMLRGELGRSNGNRNIARTFAHLRYRYLLSERWLGETFAQHEYDEFRRLETRALFGVGPRYVFFDNKKIQLSAAIAYMFEIEDLNNSEAAVDAGVTNYQHRISSYLLATVKLADNLEFLETVYAQPRIDDPDDIRVLNENRLVVKVSEKVSINTSFVLSYDAEPPDTTARTETALRSSITIGF